MQEKAAGRFRTITILSLVAVYFLLLLSSLSRSAGPGMGCPDWPSCFGLTFPPTSEAGLPDGYLEKYADRGYISMEFNAAKTWLEYVNRMVGAVIGVLLMIQLLSAWPLLKGRPRILFLSLLGVMLVGLQGWLGMQTLPKHLMPSVVIAHMVLTLAIVSVLVLALFKTSGFVKEQHTKFYKENKAVAGLLWLALLLNVSQIVLGVFVRLDMNALISNPGFRISPNGIGNMSQAFLFHKVAGFALLAIHTPLFVMLRAVPSEKVKFWGNWVGALLLLSIVSGYGLSWLNLQAGFQAVHLLVPAVLFGLQLQLLLSYRLLTNSLFAA